MPPELLLHFHDRIATEWQKAIDRLINRADASTQHRQEAIDVLRNYSEKPGKFVRPSLFLAGYWLFADKEPSKELVELGISFELLHVALLIQDDIMDASDMRRNGPSLHRRFEAFHVKEKLRGNAATYGETMAMLISDVLTNEAESLWTQAIIKKIVSRELRVFFDELKNEVYWGQYDDVALPAHTVQPDLETIISIARNKSGAYSIYRPMQIGVMSAKAPDQPWLSEFCLNLGVAFQLIDDVLGLYGDPDKTGKSIQTDLDERKMTALVYFAFSLADEKDKKILNEWYADRRTNDSLRQQCQEIFKNYPIRDKTYALAEKFYEKSLNALDQSNLDTTKKGLLQSFAEFIIKREK